MPFGSKLKTNRSKILTKLWQTMVTIERMTAVERWIASRKVDIY